MNHILSEPIEQTFIDITNSSESVHQYTRTHVDFVRCSKTQAPFNNKYRQIQSKLQIITNRSKILSMIETK